MPAKILIDGMHIGLAMKGVGLYSYNVIKRLPGMGFSFEYHVLLEKEALPLLPQSKAMVLHETERENHICHGFHLIPHMAHRTGADAVLMMNECPVGRLKSPLLMVCHDVPGEITRSQQEAGQGLSLKRRLMDGFDRLATNWTLRRAGIVFCNSRYVSNWLQSDVGVPVENISLAPCAPGVDFHGLAQTADVLQIPDVMSTPDVMSINPKFGIEGDYVLVFYTGDERENLGATLNVYARLAESGQPHLLVIAGVREGLEGRVMAEVSQRGLSGKVITVLFIPFKEASDLAGLYRGALVYLDLSLHEGFGMQVIEAMACGTPVVCSNRGALPEVAGGAALLVDPLCMDEVVTAMEKVLGDSALRATLSGKGKARARDFSWDKTARTIFERLSETVNMEGGNA